MLLAAALNDFPLPEIVLCRIPLLAVKHLKYLIRKILAVRLGTTPELQQTMHLCIICPTNYFPFIIQMHNSLMCAYYTIRTAR